METPNEQQGVGKQKSRSKLSNYVPRPIKKAFSAPKIQKRFSSDALVRRPKSAKDISTDENVAADHASVETSGSSSSLSISGVLTTVKASVGLRSKRSRKAPPQSNIDVPAEESKQKAKSHTTNGESKSHNEIEPAESDSVDVISEYIDTDIQPQKRRVTTQLRNRIHVGSSAMVSSVETMKAVQSTRFQNMVIQYQWLGWIRSLRELDPRLQIFTFFNDIARVGAKDVHKKEKVEHVHCPHILRAFQRSSVFTVWRPTSIDAIRKMIVGEARGKGLDIKGKSSKCGMLSGYVPFVQIHSNEKHKKMVRTCVKGSRVRIFFKTKEDRDIAANTLEEVAEEMVSMVGNAKTMLSNEDALTQDEMEESAKQMMWNMDDPSVNHIDDYAPNSFGLDVEERLFWEAYVMRQDITREAGSKYETGRPSEPAFQDMNFGALRRVAQEDEPRAVIYQFGEAMSPLTLLMAYEEQGSVLPVVSDFDCFLVGSHNVLYEEPPPPEQIKLVHWCVTQIEKILDGADSSDSWTKCWLTKLKEESVKGFHPNIPRFGFGDPKSYSIMESVIDRIQHNGAVRHGAECFNYYFPQELDTEFLVVSDDTFSGKLIWKYVGVEELQSILSKKIDQGYTFPLNPKWVLCDKGWKRLYDKLMARAQESSDLQRSLDSWFPPESGLRERIEEISTRHPDGFQREAGGDVVDGTAAMDLAELELKRYMTLRRAKLKLRIALLMTHNDESNANGLPQVIER